MLAVVTDIERSRQMQGIFWKLDHGDLLVDWMEEVREKVAQMMPSFSHEASGGGHCQLGPGENGRCASGDHKSFQIMRHLRKK